MGLFHGKCVDLGALYLISVEGFDPIVLFHDDILHHYFDAVADDSFDFLGKFFFVHLITYVTSKYPMTATIEPMIPMPQLMS